MAHPVTRHGQSGERSRRRAGAVALFGLLVLLAVASSGIGTAIGVVGLIALLVGVAALIRGRVRWARIAGRRAAGAVAVAGFMAMSVGGALIPEPDTETAAAEAVVATTATSPTTTPPTPTPSAARTTLAGPPTKAPAKPPVAVPTVPTSTAPALPPAPVIAMTCPSGGSVASPVYGQSITAKAPYTVVIDYGDGDRYTNDDQHLSAIFSHTYKVSGNFTVNAAVTDAAGQTASASCVYSWTQPVVVTPSGGASSSGRDTYTNVDGDEVPGPVDAPSAPDGASAQCRDGSWSYSQHRSGTCSHHGGVAQWLG